MSIIVHNISKSYKAVKAIDAVSFNVEEGELFGLIGPDGAGKTTIFRILTTLLIANFWNNYRRKLRLDKRYLRSNRTI